MPRDLDGALTGHIATLMMQGRHDGADALAAAAADLREVPREPVFSPRDVRAALARVRDAAAAALELLGDDEPQT